MNTLPDQIQTIQATVNGKNLRVAVERITPDMAAYYLTHNTCNRKKKEGRIRQYARDMRLGQWTVDVGAIAFYDNGILADGQNRMQAVVDSGTAQDFLVVRGLAPEDGANIDSHTPRTAVDIAHIGGRDDITLPALAVARVVHFGGGGGKAGRLHGLISNREKTQLADKYAEHIAFVLKVMPPGKTGSRLVANGVTRGAVVRARLAGVPDDVLTRFCTVLTTGFSESTKDSAAIALRNSLLEKKAGDKPEVFLKTMSAIYRFALGQVVSSIRTPKEEPYPLIDTVPA